MIQLFYTNIYIIALLFIIAVWRIGEGLDWKIFLLPILLGAID